MSGFNLDQDLDNKVFIRLKSLLWLENDVLWFYVFFLVSGLAGDVRPTYF